MLTLMLHRVMPQMITHDYYVRRGTAISQQKFIELLDAIAEREIPIVLSKNDQPERASVCLTFDDGYADNAWAFEQLLQRNLQAWLFPVKNYVIERFSVIDDIASQMTVCPSSTEWLSEPRTRNILMRLQPERYRWLRSCWLGIDIDRCSNSLFLTESEVRHYALQGIHLGIHGVTHRIWSSLSEYQLKKEIEQCHDWIQSLTGIAPLAACFPHGKAPTENIMQSVLADYQCFGVDKNYLNSSIERRMWLMESTDIRKKLDEYLEN
ncbi:polysaccharide deacetylase family protein [Thiothrix lacustris]|uniref:polysaccharide deacetylase family protein n=1 Tax=Thiothrix lacustris TaxID=525917 RepID=UPI0027E54C92|nr:polysaccharide deacetylase family protein [Thiothrix lacustris]WMP19032.1 polysaccharide deacetylase family protein [Thiothrix lacustris]